MSFNTCSIGLGILKGGGGTVDGDTEIEGILKAEGGGTVDGADLLRLKIQFLMHCMQCANFLFGKQCVVRD